jgi:hypothetical protein
MKKTVMGIAGLMMMTGTAYAEAQHDKLEPHALENFSLVCKGSDASVIHITVVKGEIGDVKIDLPNHTTADRNQQYAMHSNAYKEAEGWYVWTGADDGYKHYMRGNLIHSDSVFTYQEIRSAIGEDGEFSDTKLLVNVECRDVQRPQH